MGIYSLYFIFDHTDYDFSLDIAIAFLVII